MKHLKQHVLTAGILLLLLPSPSMVYSQNSELIGKWKVNIDSTKTIQNDRATELYTRVPEENKSSIETDMASREMTFESDGRYTLTIGEQELGGNWEMSDDQKRVRINLAQGTSELWIEECHSDFLIIQVRQESDTTALFHHWYLNKQ